MPTPVNCSKPTDRQPGPATAIYTAARMGLLVEDLLLALLVVEDPLLALLVVEEGLLLVEVDTSLWAVRAGRLCPQSLCLW